MRDLQQLAADLRAGKINRFDFLRGAAGLGLTAAAAISALDPFNAMQVLAAANPNVTPAKVAKKGKYLIGFSQSELNNGWRVAETTSMAAEAKKHADKYTYASTVANSDTNKQVSDVGEPDRQGLRPDRADAARAGSAARRHQQARWPQGSR